MSLDTYSNLLTEGQDWLFGRADLATKFPVFVGMFEAKVNRKLFVRQMETRGTATINLAASEPQYIALPSSFQTMRSVRLTNGTVGAYPSLKYRTGAQIDTLRDACDQVGQPEFYTVLGSELQLYPTPNAAYVVEMVWRQYLTALSNSNQINWLLQLAPDLYLYGSLMEAAPYLMDDDRVAVWKSAVQEGFDDLSKLNDQATYGSGPLVMARNRRGY
jgi:hypothetical protein